MDPLPGDVFARRIRKERERLGISQAELARRMAALLEENVEPTRVTRMEQQTRAVRLDEAVAIAESLEVPLAALLTEDHARRNEKQIQEHLADLAVAEQRWDEQRQEVERLTRALQALTGEREQLRRYAADIDPESTASLDPELAEAIDARVPADEKAKPAVTDPDA